MDWQPIETAPEDRRAVLVLISEDDAASKDALHGRCRVAANRGMGWNTIPSLFPINPTHWMPLPEPPPSSV